ncbi:MAG: 2-hydroxyhepta-2,4-diene-1,7-dioate isomerase [Chloroflexi bacterium]|nr:2-hydroxyhepta-2,4-diene-1,7-dioate isomerase [Chloroflexota bacterium]
MQLCRFFLPGEGPRLGQIIGHTVFDISASGDPRLGTVADLVQASLETPVINILGEIDRSTVPSYVYSSLDCAPNADTPYLLAPVDQQEIWAAGVTYAWSREARVREAQAKDIYVRVYDAERPELFFKALGQKVVGPNDWIGVRGDSHWNVPEPELALLLNPRMEIIGYTVGNDVSSRDIEGENPLYLPQAKVYDHSCALGPSVTLVDEAVDAQDLAIELKIERNGEIVFEGATRTSQMHRGLDELAGYLGRYNTMPCGAVLLTGTCIVPGDDFTLQTDDLVSIEIEAIGALRNIVREM